ncbi:neo-calmodulin-like [Symsagittifera roscoffensis]|uniref:neo-calmodulin-like n=1 Tax=Symsagittifera roscoffensis TaxID=84072 RepID=UPI00307B79DC
MSSVYSEEEKSYGLSRARLVEFKEAFDYFDEDYTSLLPVDRLQHHLKQMGYNATDMELDKFEVDVDPDDTGVYDFDAFMRMVAYILRTGEDIEEDLEQVFRLFDTDNSGTVSTEEMKKVFKEVDPKISKKELDELIAEADPDNSGKIDLAEFKHMMMMPEDD